MRARLHLNIGLEGWHSVWVSVAGEQLTLQTLSAAFCTPTTFQALVVAAFDIALRTLLLACQSRSITGAIKVPVP